MHTIPENRALLPMETVRVEVVHGPDEGQFVTTDSADSGSAVTVGTAKGNSLVLTDSTVSRYHLELRHAGEGIEVKDLGSTNGTVAGKVSLKHGTVSPGATLKIGRSKIRIDRGRPVRMLLHDGDALGNLRGRSASMRRLMAQIEKLAKSDVSALLFGETGVGKELIAEALHLTSLRSSGPFEIVDCGALSPTLVASELFGHEQGAFTGADRKHVGAFERADGGTLFLDEVGELPAQLQASLLGALQRRAFKRVGGTAPIEVDVRVVSATNRDLREEVNAGTFREDLYYRIGVVMLEIPALRDRKEDIPVLAEHFLREAGYSGDVKDVFSDKVLEHLGTYRWPGNVRELRNFVEAALAMGEAPNLPKSAKPGGGGGGGGFVSLGLDELVDVAFKDARALVISDFEKAYLERLLEQTDGNVSKAARKSGIHRSYLNVMLRRHGLR